MAWVPVYSIANMTAFRLAGKNPEARTHFCVSNNRIFYWDRKKKGWIKCSGEIRKIEGVEFAETLACKEREE